MKPRSEASIQNEIRRDHSHGDTRLFRQNVGQAWVGDMVRLADGSVLIRNPRPFIAGFPGLSDLGGWHSVSVTPDMVGSKVAVYVALETKAKRGRVRQEQARFIDLVLEAGGIAGVCRSSADAGALLAGVDKGLSSVLESSTGNNEG